MIAHTLQSTRASVPMVGLRDSVPVLPAGSRIKRLRAPFPASLQFPGGALA